MMKNKEKANSEEISVFLFILVLLKALSIIYENSGQGNKNIRYGIGLSQAKITEYRNASFIEGNNLLTYFCTFLI